MFASSFGLQTAWMLIELISQQSNVMIKLMLFVCFWVEKTNVWASLKNIVAKTNLVQTHRIQIKFFSRRFRFKICPFCHKIHLALWTRKSFDGSVIDLNYVRNVPRSIKSKPFGLFSSFDLNRIKPKYHHTHNRSVLPRVTVTENQCSHRSTIVNGHLYWNSIPRIKCWHAIVCYSDITAIILFWSYRCILL